MRPIESSRHYQFPFTQILDPIAQLCRLLELKAFRMLTHLKIQAGNGFVDLLSTVTIHLVEIEWHFEVVSFGGRDERRFDRFDDRPRHDSVFTIVRFLKFTPATRL